MPKYLNPDVQKLVSHRQQKIQRPTYLANPYTHPNPEVMKARIAAVTAVLEQYTLRGRPAMAPVAYTATMQVYGVCPPQGWYHYDLGFLMGCESLTLLKLPGYQHSYGVQLELATANTLGIPIHELEWQTIKQLLSDEHIATIDQAE